MTCEHFPAVMIQGIIYVAEYPERADKGKDPYNMRMFTRHTDGLTGALNIIASSGLSDHTAYKLAKMVDTGELPVTFGEACADGSDWKPSISTVD